MLDKKDMEIIMNLIKNNRGTKVSDLVNTVVRTTSDIPEIIKGMTATELIKQFGTNTFQYKFIGIKDFMQKHNIQGNGKYPPSLNYEMKHLINEIILKSMKAKQRQSAKNTAIKTLKNKLEHPPKILYGKPPSDKQIKHISENIRKELNRWE